MTITPEVLWAQRSSNSDPKKNFIYLTINVQDVDVETLKLDISSHSLTLSANSTTNSDEYNLNIDFFKEIVTTNIKKTVTGSHIFLILSKVELNDEYWPRLTKEKLKYNYIRTDFDRWVDEDEQELEELDKDDNLDGVNDLQQFNNQNLDFSALTEQLGLKNTEKLSSMQDIESSDEEDEGETETES